MGIGTIKVSTLKRIFGQNESEHTNWERNIVRILREELISLDTIKIDLFNLNNERHSYAAGAPKTRLVIFGNATRKECAPDKDVEGVKTLNGIEVDFDKFLAPSDKGIQIKSNEGTVLAEWNEKTHELNILFDLFKNCTDKNVAIFKYIMKEFERLVWYPKTLEDSWKYTANKDKLIEKFKEISVRQRQDVLEQDRRAIKDWENSLDDYRRKIKRMADNIYNKRRQVITEEESIKHVGSGLSSDLDLIIQNKKIKDLKIKDGKFIVYTEPIYIYSDKGFKYYGGNYRIELNPENSDVKFFGDNARKSFWTDHDPHPHVNGNTGVPCLGNVAASIAELSSQMQIYALVMVCIDFLEAANTSDAAGRNVVNWDLVDEKTDEIIQMEQREDIDEDDVFICPECGERHHIDDGQTVYGNVYFDNDPEDDDYDEDEDYGEAHYEDEEYVCEGCVDLHYYWNEYAEAYVRG